MEMRINNRLDPVESARDSNKNGRRRLILVQTIKAMLVPALSGVFPVLFLYGQNVRKLLLPSLGRTLLMYLLISCLVFVVYWVIFRRHALKAAIASSVFMLFFHTYGLAYDGLVSLDLFPVAHHTLLPLFLMTAVYAAWFVSKIPPAGFWKAASLLLGVLTVVNLAIILNGEVMKIRQVSPQPASPPAGELAPGNSSYPDIYYIIFDEFAGFNAMKSYWHYEEVEEFEKFLEEKGFFVFRESRSNSLATFHELAERLNYQPYPVFEGDEVDLYFDDIYQNRVMAYLKSMGYATVAFEETEHFFDTFNKPLKADYSFGYGASNNVDMGILFDNFGILVADNSMLNAFSGYYKILDPMLGQHKEWIVSTTEKMGNFEEIPAPRFVYVHLILPHYPFLLDENGNSVDTKYHYNWNYYLGMYQYAVKTATRMVENILSNADPQRPPVIILQSDHGARNILTAVSGSETMPDYPEELKYQIMNVLYLPGYDATQLPQNMNPINTFPVVFNHLFDAGLPLVK